MFSTRQQNGEQTMLHYLILLTQYIEQTCSEIKIESKFG